MRYIPRGTPISEEEAATLQDFFKILQEVVSSEDATRHTKIPDALFQNLRKYPFTDQSLKWLEEALVILRQRRLYNMMDQIDQIRQEASALRSEYLKNNKIEAGYVTCNRCNKRIKLYTDVD